MREFPDRETLKTVAAGISATFLLIAVSSAIPFVGVVTSWLIPLPVLFYRTRLSRNTALLIPVCAMALTAFTGNGLSFDFILYGGLMVLGFLLGESFEKLFSIERTILISAGGVMLAGSVALIFYSYIANTGFFSLISGYVDKNLALTINLYREMGVSEDNLTVLTDSREILVYYLTRMLPGLAASILIFTSWINILIAGSIFAKHDISFADYGTLKLWQAPDHLVWVTIASGAACMIPVDAIIMFSLNMILILMLIYFLQGIAITAFYFDRKKFPKGLRILLYSLIMIQSILKLFIIGIGFFDIWINFRKKGSDKTGTLKE